MQLLLQPLTLMTFFPLVGVLALLFVKSENKNALRWTALITSLLTFLISIWVLALFRASNPDLQLVARAPWITVGTWTIEYHLGVDGLSILLVLLTTFLTPLSILSTWTAVEDRVKDFLLFFLLLETGMLGVFVAQDLFLFYVFWEFTLVPMYFLIGIWGGPRRIYAALKFFLYTMAGSILMLLAILWLAVYQGTFSVPDLILKGGIDPRTQLWLFIAFAAAFAIKVPMWPLHSWLPDAHVEAPTAGSVILAGVLLKMGTYGFLRFNLPLFPQAAVQAAPGDRGAGGDRHHLRRSGLVCATGRQETGGLLLGEPSWICDAGPVRAEHPGHPGRHPADDQPRAEHGSAVPAGRHHLRANAHARAGGLRRAVEDHTGVWDDHADRVALVHGIAGIERIRG